MSKIINVTYIYKVKYIKSCKEVLKDSFLCKSCSKELDLNSVMIVALCDLFKIVDISRYCILEKNMQNENESITEKENNEYEGWFTDIKDKIAETNVSRNGQLRSYS